MDYDCLERNLDPVKEQLILGLCSRVPKLVNSLCIKKWKYKHIVYVFDIALSNITLPSWKVCLRMLEKTSLLKIVTSLWFVLEPALFKVVSIQLLLKIWKMIFNFYWTSVLDFFVHFLFCSPVFDISLLIHLFLCLIESECERGCWW